VTAKEYLNRAYRQKLRVDNVRMQIEIMRGAAEQTGGIEYGERVDHTRNPSGIEDAIIRLMAEEDKLRKETYELICLQSENADLINTLEDSRQRCILTYRYIGFKRWEEISKSMGYSPRWVLKQHGFALSHLDKEVENGIR